MPVKTKIEKFVSVATTENATTARANSPSAIDAPIASATACIAMPPNSGKAANAARLEHVFAKRARVRTASMAIDTRPRTAAWTGPSSAAARSRPRNAPETRDFPIWMSSMSAAMTSGAATMRIAGSQDPRGATKYPRSTTASPTQRLIA